MSGYAIIRARMDSGEVEVVAAYGKAAPRIDPPALLSGLTALKKALAKGLGLAEGELRGARLYYGDRLIDIRFDGKSATLLIVGDLGGARAGQAASGR